MHTYIHTCIHAYTHIHVHVHVHVHVHMCIDNDTNILYDICVHIYIYIYTYAPIIITQVACGDGVELDDARRRRRLLGRSSTEGLQ